MLLAGIDEAGYGPLLGPLVVSAVGFTMPSEIAQVSMWETLTKSVTARASKSATRLVVTDSKKAYRPKGGVRNLERSVLSAIHACRGEFAETLTDLLKITSLETDPHLQHPWYAHADLPLPRQADPNELRIAAKIFKNDLTNIGAAVAAVHTIPLVESRYNDLICKTNNKSTVLFMQSMRLVDRLIRDTADDEICIYLDKQGGKDRYVRDLLRTFIDAELEIITEGPDASAYRLALAGKRIQLTFLRQGDSQQLPVALASLVSKYVRELFMHQFNAYWRQLSPTLKPTAGYWTDGKRFLADLQTTLPANQVPLEVLTRRA